VKHNLRVSAHVKLREAAVEWRAVGHEIVALDVDRSEYLAVNETGSELWHLLSEGTDLARLREHLVERFDIDAERAAADVDSFIAILGARGLLE